MFAVSAVGLLSWRQSPELLFPASVVSEFRLVLQMTEGKWSYRKTVPRGAMPFNCVPLLTLCCESTYISPYDWFPFDCYASVLSDVPN